VTPVPRLTLIPYLQRWNASSSTLTINALLVPDGDPRLSLTDGFGVAGPAIADAQPVLRANLIASADQLPLTTAVDHALALPLTQQAGRGAVFDQLDALFSPSAPAQLTPRTADRTLRKYLTRSYRDAFAFVAPRTELAVIDDSYHCLLRCPPKSPPTPPPAAPPPRSWLDALGYAMRQPQILRAAGLLHTLEVALPGAGYYSDGGWLFLTLDAAGDYASAAALPGFLRSFATRVPSLSGDHERPLFTAVLFPVFADATAAAAAGGDYDPVFAEAIRFDDGFAKIVHAAQPQAMLHLDEAGDSPPPVQDLGVQLGWDDEDVLIGQNRHVGLEPDGSEPPEAPRGVMGYRVDVRAAGATAWTSLAAVHADAVPLGGLDLGSFDGELRTEVHPRSLDGSLWLPAYFTSWIDGSLVVRSADDKTLRGVPNATPPLYESVGADAVPLRYGRSYELRVRMADASGGGPTVDEAPVDPGERPVAGVAFRRWVPPRQLRVAEPQVAPDPFVVEVRRPLLGYPEVVFADTQDAVARLLEIHAGNVAGSGDPQPLALPDVDVAWAEVRVLVRLPAFDPLGSDGWQELYTTTRAFPTDPAQALTLAGAYVDVAQLTSLDVSAQTGAPGTASGPLPIPTARDVRIELRALCREAAGYYGDELVRRSTPVAIELHPPAGDEPGLLRPLDPADALRAVFLQPDSVAGATTNAVVQTQNDPSPLLVQRLAEAAGLDCTAAGLLPRAGERVVFGCAGLGHQIAPDLGSLTFTHTAELARRWLCVVRVELDRDWSWKGAAAPAFRIARSLRSLPAGEAETTDLGTVQLLHAVNATAASGEPERDRTTLVFLDAFAPPLLDGFPNELSVGYDVQVELEGGEVQRTSLSSALPIATPPRQIPELVAAGHALSPYRADAAYATTGPRARMLWFELGEPLADPRDAYFVRVLAHAPDPLLLAGAEPAADPPAYARSPLDPELARVIVPGQADDFAGLATMQKLIPAAGSDRHFAVPLPPGTAPSSPELLGFYTYEIRVGHDRGTHASPFWSTAQGRFGPSSVIEGVQHPPPPLTCGVTRSAEQVTVAAQFATPYSDGRDVLPSVPGTEIWVALYAQVHQADDASMRNVELDVRRGELGRFRVAEVDSRHVASVAWSNDELESLLTGYGLDEDTPLSVLAVELLPEPNSPFEDPLRGQLGELRILRSSPLTAVQRLCC
jgi:hypothetical protein